MKVVGILRGGPSPRQSGLRPREGGTDDNYYSSIKEGGKIIAHIFENLKGHFRPLDMLVDRDGVWHISGRPISPSELSNKVDVVWNTIHPSFSEIMRGMGIPSIEAPAFGSTLKKSGEMLREHMKQVGVKMPRTVLLPLYQEDFDLPPPRLRQGAADPKKQYAKNKAREVYEKFSSPWIVKSFTPENSMAIHLAKTLPELERAIEDGVNHGDSPDVKPGSSILINQNRDILVEEFIGGKAGALHSLSGFRNEDVYVFPPGGFSEEEKEKLIELAENLHRHIGAPHYLKTDFILHPRGVIYVT